MKKRMTLILGLILIGLLTAPLLRAETVKFLGEPVEIMPLKDIKSGMVGYGESEFSESQGVERFEVEILTISHYVKNKYIIWGKSWGGPNNIVDRAGVIKGMSGSPVYLKDPKDGQYKLIGALAYGFAFQLPPQVVPPEANTGITPIEEMLGLGKLGSAYYSKGAEEPLSFLLNPEKIEIPLLFVGDKKAIKMLKAEMKKQILNSQEFEAVPWLNSAINTNQLGVPLNTLKAGEAVAAVLSTGDFPLAAIGTVTLANSKGFLAFGHPFFWSGYSNIPVFRAKIGTVVPNLEASFKLEKEIVGPQLGTIVVDSLEGILGIWHSRNTMLPVKVSFSKTHLNQVKTQDSWNIKLARNNPYSSRLFIYSILYPIRLGAPNLNNLSFDIEIVFTYEDNGTGQKLPVSKSFFSKDKEGMLPNIISLGAVYGLFEKARKELIKIDINIVATQERTEIPTVYLSNIEPYDRTRVKSDEELLLGLMLSISDKEKDYSKTIKLKAPDFQGEMRIKIQDSDSRLMDLVAEVPNNQSEIEKVFNFIRMMASKKNIFYTEIQYVKSIAQRQGKDNKGWQEIDKKTEELINTEILEVELPEVNGKFNVKISGQRTILVIKDEQGEEAKKTKQKNTIKFKPGLFLTPPLTSISLDARGKLRTNLIGVDVGLLEYKRLKLLNFGFGVDVGVGPGNIELYSKFAPVKVEIWKKLFAEANTGINTSGKCFVGLTLSLKVF